MDAYNQYEVKPKDIALVANPAKERGVWVNKDFKKNDLVFTPLTKSITLRKPDDAPPGGARTPVDEWPLIPEFCVFSRL